MFCHQKHKCFIERFSLSIEMGMGFVAGSRVKSPWLFHLNTGSCAGCDIEIVAALTPRYDVERLGCVLVGSPRHADVLLVTGPVTRQMLPRFIRVYEQVPEPKVVVAVGTCASSGTPFLGSPMVEGPVDRIVPVDVYVVGCPPRPEAIVKGVVTAVKRKFG
jgi:membrane-bound hydrogenase subunit mbhJ